MKKSKSKLLEFDVKNISSILNRIPTDWELQFIEHVLSFELSNREYLQILDRLNTGAKRNPNAKIEIADGEVLHINSGFKVYNNQKLICDRDESGYTNSINGISNIVNTFCFNNITQNNIDKIIRFQGNKKSSTAVRLFNRGNLNVSFATNIGLAPIESYGESIEKGAVVYKLTFGKRYIKKYVNLLSTFIQDIREAEIPYYVKSINWNGIGRTFIEIIQECQVGISLHDKSEERSIKSYFIDDKTLSVIFIIPKYCSTDVNIISKKLNVVAVDIGEIIDESILLIHDDEDSVINLPISAFNIQLNSNTRHFQESKIVPIITNKTQKSVKNTSYSNQLLKIYNTVKVADEFLTLGTKNNSLIPNFTTYSVSSNAKKSRLQLAVTQASINKLIDTEPRLSGRIAVVNAARRLSCTGIKPKIIAIQNIFPENDKSANWKASELLQGQEEAVRELGLDIGNRDIDTYANEWYQNVTCIGVQGKTKTMDISFKNTGDFISLLGSHRGELAKSTYEEIICSSKDFVPPTVDLRMEERLQDVVRQGIMTNLIKSATNVGAGGIAVALAKSLAVSAMSLGARIHLSRKLKDEELLFGETQGLVVVTLSEEDIMEFERICMTIGVPSTTIGRVTDNDLFTFNDLMKLSVVKLRDTIN